MKCHCWVSDLFPMELVAGLELRLVESLWGWRSQSELGKARSILPQLLDVAVVGCCQLLLLPPPEIKFKMEKVPICDTFYYPKPMYQNA